MTIVASNCQIIDSDGNIQVLSEDADSSDLPETSRNLLEHAQWVSVRGCVRACVGVGGWVRVCVCVCACVCVCVCVCVWLHHTAHM